MAETSAKVSTGFPSIDVMTSPGSKPAAAAGAAGRI